MANDVPWAAVDPVDIVGRFRDLTAAETTVVGQMIADAQDILEQRAEQAGITGTDVAADTRLTRQYVRIVAQMVIRVLRNPDGLLQYTTDDFTARLDSVVSGGMLYVSDDELETMRPVSSRRRTGAFTIRPARVHRW